MISSGYSTDLYCDCPICAKRIADGFRPVTGEYTGETWAETAKQARKDGWRITQDRTACFAPKKSHEGRQYGLS